MATDTPARAAGRPRPVLLLALAVVLGGFLAVKFWPWPSATPAANPPPRTPAAAQKRGTDNAVMPEDLDVRLGELKEQRPTPVDTERNPFGFKPKPPPPPPPAPPVVMKPVPEQPVVPPGPPPPPAIPLKFMGTVEGSFGKLAAFTDCRRTFSGREGEIVDGRYRVVKIGIESVVLQYVDGRGTQTIRLSGQECVGK